MILSVLRSFVLLLLSVLAKEAAGQTTSTFTADPQDDSYASLVVADAILLMFAALFAGLTLSIMGLDTLSLEIIADSGSEPDKTYAKNILPIRQLGNQLLCTLILGNVMVNTLIAQITDSRIHGWVATVLSTAIITLGGEILPQALMSAHALMVGSKSTPLVRFFVLLFYPVCKPLSIFLDAVIGTDPGQIYERNELKKLMFMHAAHSKESGLHAGEVDLMMGAMELHEKTVMSVMTPLHEVFMLEASERLNEETIHMISEHGHSRIPVYQTHKNNIVGVLFAKDLLMINPDENTRVMQLVTFYHRKCHVVPLETKLISMLKYFQTGKSHIAVVQEVIQRPFGDPVNEVKGIVTMEDVIEELIHNEIFDEYDVGSPSLIGTVPTSRRGIGLAAKSARRIQLNQNQLKACALFLNESLPQLDILDSDVGPHMLQVLREHTSVYKVRAPRDARGLERDDKLNVWLYRSGVASQLFTLVISGRVEVFAGKEEIRLELHSWSVLGADALSSDHFIPSFSCRVVQDSTIMQISHAGFLRILEACKKDGEHDRAKEQ
jgi:metal transporter CNNM